MNPWACSGKTPFILLGVVYIKFEDWYRNCLFRLFLGLPGRVPAVLETLVLVVETTGEAGLRQGLDLSTNWRSDIEKGFFVLVNTL